MRFPRETGSAGLRRLREWLLLDGNRTAIAAGLLVVAFGAFWWLSLAGVVDVERDPDAMRYLFQMLAGGNLTLVTIVISINQLVLSRELRTPGELRSEQEAAQEYRTAVEEEVDPAVVPESAENFLIVLLRDTRDLLQRLADEVDDLEGGGLRDDASRLQSTIDEELGAAMDLLEESDVGVFRSLSAILDADFATAINHGRWLRTAHGDEIPDSLAASLEDLEDRLGQLDVARQYFKTIYVQRELADLSRVVLLAGLAAIGVAIALLSSIAYLAASQPPWVRRLVVPAAVAISLGPLAVLFAHVLRIATVARRTAAVSPFVP